jgi:hypothetical protein
MWIHVVLSFGYQESVETYGRLMNRSDEEILPCLQMSIRFNWYASFTCKMEGVDDEMAVVNSKARVIGVQGLGPWMQVHFRSFTGNGRHFQ